MPGRGSMVRGKSFVGLVVCGLLPALFVGLGVRDASGAEARPVWPFFAFDNGTGGQAVPFGQQVKMLKELGYDGIAYSGTRRIAEMLEALDGQGLKMLSIYVGANVDPGAARYDAGLPLAIEQLKGRDVQIWLFVLGKGPASEAADQRAVAIVREVADLAESAGLRVALYPHVGFYVATVHDALRVVQKAGRKNVGLCFNLCHFLRLEDAEYLEKRLAEARPHLFCVNINGADSGPPGQLGWDRLIQTLDRGSFDVGRVLITLKRLDYRGPVGLQCYAIPGDRRDNLRRSIEAWRKLTARAAAEQPRP